MQTKNQFSSTHKIVLVALFFAAFGAGNLPSAHARETVSALTSAPTVTDISPALAPNDLDTPIIITGTEFITLPTVVLNSTPLANVNWISDTQLTATVPWGLMPGVYTLTVTNPDGGTSSLASAFTVTQGIGQWNGGNLFGGEVHQILMKPGDPNTLYASAYRIGGLFRSQDAGEHWSYVSADVTINNSMFAIDPLHPDWLYGFDYKGLHRSQDEGDTWTTLMPNVWPDGRSINSPQVYVSPYNPQVLFVGSSESYGSPYPGSAFGLIKSTNGGTSWQIVANLEGLAVQDVAFYPTNSLKMVLATSDGRVFQSDDGGDTWSEVTKPSINSLGIGGSITYNPYRPTEVWIASSTTPGEIYKSTDEFFSSWQNVTPTSGTGWGIWVAKFTGANSVYITGHHSTDGGQTWQSFGPQTSYGTVSFDPADPQIGYIGDVTYGVQKTIDGGQTWQIKNQGLSGMYSWSIKASLADPLRVFATFEHWPGIYRSTDGANNWTYLPIDGSYNVRWICEDPFDSQRLYVAADSGFYVSTNVGGSWSALGWNLLPSSSGGMPWAMAADPHHAGHLLVGLVSGNYGLGTGFLYSSSDYGVSWQSVSMPQEIAWTTNITFDPETPGLVYLTTYGTGVYRSTDNGVSWKRIDDLQQSDMQYVGSITIATHPQHMLLVGTLPYPYRSLDGGATWERAQRKPSGGSNFIFANGDSHRLYFGTGVGLFFSSNAGDSWQQAAGALGRLQIMALDYANANGRTILYAATSGGNTEATSSMSAETHQKALTTASNLVNAGIYRYVQDIPMYKLFLPLLLR